MDISIIVPSMMAGGLVSCLIGLLIVATKKYHGKFSLDGDEGIQKMHQNPTPRVGGIALAFGFIAAGFFLPTEIRPTWTLIGISGCLAFAFGLAEDITNQVGVKWRLLATMAAGLIFSIWSGYSIASIDNSWFDYLLGYSVFSLAFTAFAIGGAANSINIVDGFHGLSSGTIITILISIILVALRVDDHEIAMLAFSMIGVIVGFMIINFPFGYLFLGDAGAYFSGFVVATLVVMLPAKHAEVSPWVSLLVLGYPVIETLFSIARRWWTRVSAGDPDNNHLHHLIYGGIARRVSDSLNLTNYRNAITSVITIAIPACVCLFVYFSSFSTPNAILWLGVSAAIYCLIYAYNLNKASRK